MYLDQGFVYLDEGSFDRDHRSGFYIDLNLRSLYINLRDQGSVVL